MHRIQSLRRVAAWEYGLACAVSIRRMLTLHPQAMPLRPCLLAPRLAHAHRLALAGLALAAAAPLQAQTPDALAAAIASRADALNAKVVAWRRDLHEHPELSNREVRTAGVVADHLRKLGMEVQTGVAHTGVVGILRGGKPGPVVALRADMDALPVTEEVDLPFRSRVKTEYNGQAVGVMHACGHDAHTAILMGVAELLAGMKADIPGTVKFIFQPAEEGVPAGERGGAAMMIAEGVLESPKPDAIFGLHVFPFAVGAIQYRPEGLMASSDQLRIVVRGRQTHGAMPWAGIDPIVASAQVINALQTIVSRQVDLTKSPAIVTIGSIQGGVRNNIVPDSVVLLGTIRTFDQDMRTQIHERVKRAAEEAAGAVGASADVSIIQQTAVTYNDPALTARMVPSLERAAGADRVSLGGFTTTAEDFSYFQERVPGLFIFLGVAPPDANPATVAPNHSPRFFVDERALPVGVRALAGLALDFLHGGPMPAPMGARQ